MKMFACSLCSFRMPETNARAVAAHKETHAPKADARFAGANLKPEELDRPTEEIVRRVGKSGTALERSNLAIAMLSMNPLDFYEEFFRKPILREVSDLEREAPPETPPPER